MILCYSGGLDSLIAWHYLGKPPSIYFKCAEYSQVEMDSIRISNPNCIVINRIDLSLYQRGEKAYIPHRNIIFAALASNYDARVVIAGIKDDQVPDKNPQAFELISEALTVTSESPVTVTSPFWDMTKSQIIKWFLDNVPNALSLIKTSVSCYSGEKYCGECPSCFRKAVALWENNIKLDFANIKLMEEYYMKALHYKYNPARCNAILKYIEELPEWRMEKEKESSM